MQNYSDKPNSVRVDFFKESGKWYTTEAVICDDYEGILPDCLKEDVVRHLRQADGRIRLSGMWAVVLDPYHKYSHPQMFKIP